ncbi:MAG: NUDIX domain-containing protein [Balneolaceae bacterium]
MKNYSKYPDWDHFLNGISIDCVIFGYHQKELKILILEYKQINTYALPGGFIKNDENLNEAAKRVLAERTGLKDIYLNQFHTFGDLSRHDPEPMKNLIKKSGMNFPDDHWLFQRFITVGYYALVDFNKATPVPGPFSDRCEWYDVNDLPELMQDHRLIVEKALGELRDNIDHKAVGLNLLDNVFTMGELKDLYETISGKKLNRTSFHRKMMKSGRLKRLGKKSTGKAHRSPYLYRFAGSEE